MNPPRSESHADAARRRRPWWLLAGVAVLGTSCAQRVTVRKMPPDPVPLAASLETARQTERAATGGGSSPAERRRYNHAVAQVVRHLEIGADGKTATLKAPDRSLPIVLADGRSGGALPREFDAVDAADFLKVKGLREHVAADGLGAPVVIHSPPAGYTTEEGIYQPGTALLRFDGPGGEPVLTLHNRLDGETVAGAPLAGDFTAAIASQYAAKTRQFINIPAMLRVEKFDEELGLSRFDAITPGKIPVVFVHGLKSSPFAWKDTINELRDDPVVRERFEFWTFGYATGAPIQFSAMKLRASLQGLATFRDINGAPTRDMVLIGHSMGGLLSRLMTESSGDADWYRLSTEPLEKLPLSETDRDLARRLIYYDRLPYVKRVVFISTPHGGSDFAGNPVGRLGSELIRLPARLLVVSSDILKQSFNMLTPVGREALAKVPNSIDQLESNSDFLSHLKEKPLNPGVTFHSIVGDKGLAKGGAPMESDGVVPYTSSHIEPVASELVVPSDHGAHDAPETVAELRRILRLHAGAPEPTKQG
ncbi:MAG: alpha/beta fold hydrolase [Akkermansiaceae bacterium]|nr:alpha/beta fold hydrolase [Akkermansiaceae bacterium]